MTATKREGNHIKTMTILLRLYKLSLSLTSVSASKLQGKKEKGPDFLQNETLSSFPLTDTCPSCLVFTRKSISKKALSNYSMITTFFPIHCSFWLCILIHI